jgi:hypothetical protein
MKQKGVICQIFNYNIKTFTKAVTFTHMRCFLLKTQFKYLFDNKCIHIAKLCVVNVFSIEMSIAKITKYKCPVPIKNLANRRKI